MLAGSGLAGGPGLQGGGRDGHGLRVGHGHGNTVTFRCSVCGVTHDTSRAAKIHAMRSIHCRQNGADLLLAQYTLNRNATVVGGRPLSRPVAAAAGTGAHSSSPGGKKGDHSGSFDSDPSQPEGDYEPPSTGGQAVHHAQSGIPILIQ